MKTSEECKNIIWSYRTENDLDGVEFTAEDVEALDQMYSAQNPMPLVSRPNDMDQAVRKAMWSLRTDEAHCQFMGQVILTDVESHSWCIEQAIVNRSNMTVLGAAMDYAERFTDAHVPAF